MHLLLFHPNGRCLLRVEGDGVGIFDFILSVIHHDCFIDDDECPYQTTFDFSER